MLRRLTPTLPLLGILLLALALRVWGLGWGLPSATHYFSYHPDESIILGAAMRLNVFQGRMLPHFYNYGSLQLYLVYFANTLAYLFGSSALVITDFATQHAAWAHQYLVGRWLTVAMGTGTVAVTYALGQRLWGRRTGLLAALILAVMPLHAQHSHWLTVDVPATFWATLSLFWSARLATGDPKPRRAALLAGLFVGLAAATKYNLALMVLPLLVASLMPPVGATQRVALTRLAPRLLAPPLLGAGGAIFAFLLACPGVLLDSQKFAQDFRYEAYHVRHLPGAEFTDTGSGFVYHITRNLDAGLGLPLLLLSLASIVYAVYRRERGDGLLAAFALPYYVLIGLAVVRYARYVIPLLPILALWTGRLLADLSRLPHPAWRRAQPRPSARRSWYSPWRTPRGCCRPCPDPDRRDCGAGLAQPATRRPRPVGFATAALVLHAAASAPGSARPCPAPGGQQTPPDVQARIVYTARLGRQTLTADRRAPYVVLSEYDYDDALRSQDPAAHRLLAGTLRGGLYAQGRGFLSDRPDRSRNGFGCSRMTCPRTCCTLVPPSTIYQRK